MAAQTPDTNSRFDLVDGSQRMITATFASVTANDTWKTGLGVITNVVGTAGTTAALLTKSGGTVTFASTSTDVNVVARGY